MDLDGFDQSREPPHLGGANYQVCSHGRCFRFLRLLINLSLILKMNDRFLVICAGDNILRCRCVCFMGCVQGER